MRRLARSLLGSLGPSLNDVPILSSWNRLYTGLAAAAATAVAAVAILVYGRVGQVHGPTVELHVAMANSLGLIRGSDVWLDGQKVGTVNAIALRPPAAVSTPTVLTISVAQSTLSHFRSDSHASIKSGGTLLGTPVLFVLSGTGNGRPLQRDDTLTVPPVEASAVVQVDSTLHQIPGLMAGLGGVAHDVSWIAQQAMGGGRGAKVGQQLQRMERSTGRLAAKMSASHLTDSVLTQRLSRALAHADSLRQLVQGGALALQRVRRDTTFAASLVASRRDLLHLQQIVASRGGMLAQMQGDSSVDQQLRRAVFQVNQLIADVSKHPLRYIAF